MGNILTTYALLGYLKETSQSSISITELYIPLVKKALTDYSYEHGLSEYKGRSLSEIADKIKSIFELEIPIPILYKIMSSIKDEINDDGIFSLYDDGAFIIKSFVFDDINDKIEQEQNNVKILEDDYAKYCEENGFVYDFEELKSFILSSQIDLFTNKQSDFIDLDYHVSKYVNERIGDSVIFRIMGNIYLGGLIVSYLEQNITKQVTDAELLLDTNFIISLLDLNTEDAHQTCNQLFSLCTQLGYRFTILNSTINQIKILLSNRVNDFASKDFIGAVRGADVFNACIRRGLDKTSLERIKDNLLKTIQNKGIVIIQDAQIKDIIDKAKKSSDYKELLARRKNAESALNDTVAKHYVEYKRGKNIREFVDVKCWFLHNSYSTYDYSIGRKIHERYLISANELLILLWLSSPAQGYNVKITDLARSGLSAYVTKYRRAKAPSHEVLKNIKKRIDDTLKLGVISEEDTFNLCIRMAEGHLTHNECVESLVDTSITDEQFANKLKEYSQEVECIQKKQKLLKEEEISLLKNQIEIKDKEFEELKNRMEKIEKAEKERKEREEYIKQRDIYVNKELKKIKWERCGIFLFFMITIGLWSVNEYFGNVLPRLWANIISFLSFLTTMFGIPLCFQTSIFDILNFKNLKLKLEQRFDDMNK